MNVFGVVHMGMCNMGEQVNLAEKNGMWRGDKACIDAIHQWVRTRLVKSTLCQRCKKVPPVDMANISGRYKRDLDDWEWLCRKCHMESDGRLERFKKLKFIDMSERLCFLCKSGESNIQKRNGRERWYNFKSEKICHKCYMKEHDKKKAHGYAT